MELKTTLTQSLEILFTNLIIFLPFILSTGAAVIMILISTLLPDTNPLVETAGRMLLLLAFAIVFFVTSNWGLFLIATAVKTKQSTMKNSFEPSLNFLLRYMSLFFMLGFVIGVSFLFYLFLASVSPFFGGIGVVLFILVTLTVLLNWGLAIQALYSKNSSVRGSISVSLSVLKENRLQFATLIGILVVIALFVRGFGIISSYLGPLGSLVLGALSFLYTVWVIVVLFVYYRNVYLRRH